MLKREFGAESNGKLPHLLTPGNTAALVLEFAAELQPSFCPSAEYFDDGDKSKCI